MVKAGERCGTCSKARQQNVDRWRGTAHERGYTAQWARASREFLNRPENALCRDPFGDHGARYVVSQCTDHVIPHRGDMTLFWDERNWQPLCRECHGKKTAREDGGYGNVRQPTGER